MKRQLTMPNVLGLTPRPSGYALTVAALVVAVVVASIIEPPTAYLVPLIVAAWAVAIWSYKRETAPRYKRHE